MQKLCIRKILIKDSPMFKEATLLPNLRFNVFSGASGAGKSVLMESILALFGLKDCNAQLLEATLELYGIPPEFAGFLEEGEVILTLSKKDKVRYFLNAQNIPKKKVQELFAPFLRHLSTKSYEVTSEQNLFLVLDSFLWAKNSTHTALLDAYKEAFLHFKNTQEALKKLQEEALRVAELKEFVRFEIKKLESIKPKAGEYEELLKFKKDLSKKEKIAESLQTLRALLSQSHSITQFLQLTGNTQDSDLIFNALNTLENLCDQENERLASLEMVNPEEILNRLEALSALNRRYGGINEALEYLAQKKQELQKYECLDDLIKEATYANNTAKTALKEKAKLLSNARNKGLQAFKETLDSALNSLKLPNAQVQLQPILEAESYSILGAEHLNITLNTELKNLSSGEFNRFRLSLLLTQSTQECNQAIIILDEVDANLSGEESQGVALALKNLSHSYQIFAISHQPHMPCLADAHFLVKKQASKAIICPLDKKGRIQEIARMISGEHITKEALEFATQQLSKA